MRGMARHARAGRFGRALEEFLQRGDDAGPGWSHESRFHGGLAGLYGRRKAFLKRRVVDARADASGRLHLS